MPLMVDGLMTNGAADPGGGSARALRRDVPAVSRREERDQGRQRQLRVVATRRSRRPTMGDAASIARHKAQVGLKKLGTELCVGCHRGFLSPDMGMPVHLSGLDEPGMWRNSAWTGNGMGRVDKVEKKTLHRLPHGARARERGGVRREARDDRLAPVPRRAHVDGVDARRHRAPAPPAGQARGRGVDRRRGRADRERSCERRDLGPPRGRCGDHAGHPDRLRRGDPQPARRAPLPGRRARHPGHVGRGRGRRSTGQAARVIGADPRDRPQG